jgi:alpha-N-arabinofuranosidase
MRATCAAYPPLFVLLLSAGSMAQITQSTLMPKVVEIKVDSKGDLGVVPPRIFGTFIEPIDYSIDNGVIAEILVNGSLEAGLWNHAMSEQIFRDQPELIESTNSTGIPVPWQSLNSEYTCQCRGPMATTFPSMPSI